MRYKSIILSIILIIAVLLSSCTSSQEIEDVGIVLATGIDMEGDKYPSSPMKL
jgi:PBP1b-binding outer membrane lipoprotein LpoB